MKYEFYYPPQEGFMHYDMLVRWKTSEANIRVYFWTERVVRVEYDTAKMSLVLDNDDELYKELVDEAETAYLHSLE